MSIYDFKSVSDMEREQRKRFSELAQPSQEGFIQKITDPKFLPIVLGSSLLLSIAVFAQKRRNRKKK